MRKMIVAIHEYDKNRVKNLFTFFCFSCTFLLIIEVLSTIIYDEACVGTA